MGWICKHMKLNNRFYINYAILLILFVSFPLLSTWIPHALGFAIICSMSGVIGIANSISQSTGYGLGSIMPMKCVAWLTVGTGISGIIMNLCRVGCLLIFGSEGDEALTKGTITYFAIAGVIVGSCIFMHMKFSRSKFFKFYIHQA